MQTQLLDNASKNWFGDSFTTLHPLLQKLHSDGGTLNGEVDISLGTGIAGVLGKRLAGKLGVPVGKSHNTLRVEISHTDTELHWSRCFNNTHKMTSVFVPSGSYPNGHWTESTGAVTLQLGVEIIDGGWHWVQQKTAVRGIAPPQWLFPQTEAYKTIADDKYVFSVTISAPLLGKLLSYRGQLTAD